MKLYYAPSACSLAVHIALSELGLHYQLQRVDLRSHTIDGRDYYAVNAKGYVPVLELDNGERLTEAAVVLQYVADQVPGRIAPAFGSFERYRVMEWLNFIATEVHKGFGPLWKSDLPEASRATAVQALGRRFDYLSGTLARQPYLSGSFTIADAYLFTILSWAPMLKVDLARWPALTQYVERVRVRPAVQAALREEQLVKTAA